MQRPSLDIIEIDYDEKEVIIRNNLQLYRALKSGAILALFPIYDAITSLQATVESVDPALTQIIEILTAGYLYYRPLWNTRFVRSLTLNGSGSGTASINLSFK